jgi:prepilin-type N-terminal cleavage/methylation domain-containing protein
MQALRLIYHDSIEWYIVRRSYRRGVWNMRAAGITKTVARGFSLVEALLVVAIIGILGGVVMLALGNQGEKTQATIIMSDLDTIKNAMLAYSMEYRTRASDGFNGWETAASSAIRASLDKYVEPNLGGGDAASRFAKLKVSIDRTAGRINVGFNGFPASATLRNEISKKIDSNRDAVSGAYSAVSESGGNYSVWLRVR